MLSPFKRGRGSLSVKDATVRLRKQMDDAGTRAPVIHGGAHAIGSGPGIEAHPSCWSLDVVPTFADLRGGQTKAISLPSSLGQLSSTGPIAARPPATQIGGHPAPGSCLFHSRRLRLVELVSIPPDRLPTCRLQELGGEGNERFAISRYSHRTHLRSMPCKVSTEDESGVGWLGLY